MDQMFLLFCNVQVLMWLLGIMFSSVAMTTVVIEAYEGTPPLDEGSIFWTRDKRPVGKVWPVVLMWCLIPPSLPPPFFLSPSTLPPSLHSSLPSFPSSLLSLSLPVV